MPLARPLFSRLTLVSSPNDEVDEPPPAQRGIILLRASGTRRRAGGAPPPPPWMLPPETLALPLPLLPYDVELFLVEDGMDGGLACTPARV